MGNYQNYFEMLLIDLHNDERERERERGDTLLFQYTYAVAELIV